jgi:hypothetical protein
MIQVSRQVYAKRKNLIACEAHIQIVLLHIENINAEISKQ